MSFSSTNNNAHNNINNNDNMANSSLDFVSADVNEVLQDAPQILTNREQPRDGQHSNELGESTTVQVTKQGGDEDPMEVTAEEAETEERESRTSTTIMHLAGYIWTHLIIGCLAFFFIFLWFITRPDTHIQFQMIAVMGLAAIIVSLCIWDKLYGPLRAGIFSCMGWNVTETTLTTTPIDLPRPRHCKLPTELDREIFLFLTPAAQRKFIWGLNWNFYAMFRYRLLLKTKRVRNPRGNRWDNTNTRATVAANGLNVSGTNTDGYSNVFAEQSFPTSGPNYREDDFPGTVLYYFEVKIFEPEDCLFVGLTTDLDISAGRCIGKFANSYAISTRYQYRLANGDYQNFEFPHGAIRPKKKGYLDVYGCGLVMDPDNKLAIFFTLNGQLLGRQIPICPSVDRLFPAITISTDVCSIEANFGDDKGKPFLYDIKNCPGMDLPCF